VNDVRPKYKKEKKVALFVDGPNMLRKEFMIDLRELKRGLKRFGRLMIAKVFINQFAPEKLIEAIMNEGFEAAMVLTEEEENATDVDVHLAISVIETVLIRDVDVIAIASRDADFIPVIQKAKEYGKKVIVLGADPGFSAGLKNAADYVVKL